MSIDRVQSFCDGVFAVIITILVINLRPPAAPTLTALVTEWPTAVSYAASYLFVAITWLNGHHLLQHADRVTPKLIWSNFAHLFAVSLVPFSTAWMSRTRLSGVPVCLYACVFVLVNMSYMLLASETVHAADGAIVSSQVKKLMFMRSAITLGIFMVAAAVALWLPVLGFCIVTGTLLSYMRPETPVRSWPRFAVDRICGSYGSRAPIRRRK